MKVSLVRSWLALIFPLMTLLACSTSPSIESEQVSYQSSQWSEIMKGYDGLDNALGDLETSVSDSNFQHFQTFLLANGLSKAIIDKLILILEANDFKFNRPAYHGLIHTARVGNLVSSSLNTPHASGLTNDQKILLTVAALLHDIDPVRIKGTPPRVSSTFVWLDKNTAVKSLLDDIEREKSITKDQIKSIIKFTDFDVDPKKLADILDDADKMTDQHFNVASAQALKIWGRRLAYLDQVAMYVGSFSFATQAVVGLAHEFRKMTMLKLKAEGKPYDKERMAPSDVDILSNTAKFLSMRLNDPNFAILPQQMQDNFKQIQKLFDSRWSGKTSLN